MASREKMDSHEKIGRYRPKRTATLESRVLPRKSRALLIVFVFFVAVLIFPLPGTAAFRAFFLALLLPRDVTSLGRTTPPEDILKYIHPLIGTTNGGHVFPGASMPYGMAKPVADTLSKAENAAGYVEDMNRVKGFSHLHDSGTGGNPSMGNFPIFVHPGCPNDNFTQCTYTTATRSVMRWPYSAKAEPGYFYIRLKNSVAAEMTASDHVAMYRFTFPDKDEAENGNDVRVPYSPLLLIDLVDLSNSGQDGMATVNPETGRITGGGMYNPSFGSGHYRAFFCADFRGAEIRKTGTFKGDTAAEELKSFGGAEGSFYNPSGSAGAFVHFDRPSASDEIFARVGLSFISVDKACQNAENEIPDFDFKATRLAAREAWAKKLSVIEIDETGIDPALLVTFWSGLYRSMLSPQNYTGENPLWDSDEPYYDSFYCIWDSFRAQHPLLTIMDPVAQTEMVRTLIDIYRYEGKLPDCRMSFCKGFTQGGTNADVVIGDAFLKNISDGVDWATAYEAVVSDAEVEPKQWGTVGRGSLVSYHELGYIPWDDKDSNGTGPMTRSVSRTVEYAYDDFAIALMAEGMGNHEDYKKYLARSGNWKNLWNAQQEDVLIRQQDELVWSDFKGFLQPRLLDGSFRYHETRRCSPVHEMHSCYLDTRYDTYEGSPWLYSFFVPQDMTSLIQTMGGRELFIDRLEYFHESGIIYMGNEQSFLPVFQFHYGGRPGLSSKWAHKYIPDLFNTTSHGIPGNDDCAMGAFTGFAMMGFFPVAGQDVYLLTPPFFPEVKLRARNGKWAIIRVTNFDPSYTAKYIQSAKLNGKTYTKSWITHDFFMKGGVLEFIVGERESTWGSGAADLPPSWTPEKILQST